MKRKGRKSNRIVGVDMHPDVFSAAIVEGKNAVEVQIIRRFDRLNTKDLESWSKRHLQKDDIVVLEASGNSFEVVERLHKQGITAVVLESAQAGKIKENYCNDDYHSAVKLARVYLSGLAKEVWVPGEQTRAMREILFAYRNCVKDCTRERNRIRSFLSEHCVRLPKGTRLTQESGLNLTLQNRSWSQMQEVLLRTMFERLRENENRRKQLEEVMVRELIARPHWSRLWRLMGIRHKVAFAMMAIIGDIHRFPTAKKLVGYIGLSPRKEQSGNDAKGKDRGLGHGGRSDLRNLLIQSAQNALSQKASPLHKWGWKLTLKKCRNLAAAAVARKIVVASWYLLKGYFTPLTEIDQSLESKLLKVATVLGKSQLNDLGFPSRNHFVQNQFELWQLST